LRAGLLIVPSPSGLFYSRPQIVSARKLLVTKPKLFLSSEKKSQPLRMTSLGCRLEQAPQRLKPISCSI
jgi:hypothetical protein